MVHSTPASPFSPTGGFAPGTPCLTAILEGCCDEGLEEPCFLWCSNPQLIPGGDLSRHKPAWESRACVHSQNCSGHTVGA